MAGIEWLRPASSEIRFGIVYRGLDDCEFAGYAFEVDRIVIA